MVLHTRHLVARIAVGIALGGLLLTGGPGMSVAQAAAPAANASFEEPPADSDGDGIPDEADQCPFEPGVAENYGCPYVGPTDSDGDGVYDDSDQCPNEAGSATYSGCPAPDQDGDGIADDVDACPTLYGPVYDGCPLTDMDGDGVFDDGTDQCPNEPGPADYQGCPAPDSDGDGIADNNDSCPSEAGLPEYGGCPYTDPGPGSYDSDGDGVYDDVDSCPSEAGLPEYGGCPYTDPGTGSYDSDGDGVYDDVDSCPSEFGSADYNGCPVPDQDGDGLADDVDACPTLYGPLYDGCPLTDYDGDGVYDDGTDQCPNEFGSPDYNGCPAPDEDGDGFSDDVDGCPGTPQGEGVDGVGCSLTQLDADNDGYNDEIDQCDDTPDGDVIDETGCTVTLSEDVAVAAAAVVFDDRCGATRDTVTVPSSEGVAYLRGGKQLSPGVVRVSGKVVVVARAEAGYVLHGRSSWTRKFTSTPCPQGRLSVSSPAPGKVRVVNGADAVLRIKVGSQVRVVHAGDSVLVTTRSGRLRWSARWTGLLSPRTGFVRVDRPSSRS
jgi:hypothetical protein